MAGPSTFAPPTSSSGRGDEPGAVGLAHLDTELRFVAVNEALAAMTDLPIEAHPGRAAQEVLPTADGSLWATLRHVLSTGEPAVATIETPSGIGGSRAEGAGSDVVGPAGARGRWTVSILPIAEGSHRSGVLLSVSETAGGREAGGRGARHPDATERRARVRAEAYARLSSSLVGAATAAEAAALVVHEGMVVLGADAGFLALLDERGRTLEIVATSGYGPHGDAYQRFPADASLPAATTARTGTPCYIEAPEEWPSESSGGAAVHDAAGYRAAACIPLVTSTGTAGSAVFSFTQPHRFDIETREFAEALGRLAGQSIERTRVAQEERRARQAAEESRRLVERTAEVLSGALHPVEAADSLATLVVPEFADWCAVDLGDRDGTIRHTSIAHRDPAKVELGHRLRAMHPPAPDAPSGATAIIRTGSPEIILEVPSDYADAIEDEDLASVVRSLTISSYVGVPITAGGRAIGALSVFMAESGRHFADDDVDRMLDLGRRAGVAFESARLFEVQLELTEAERRARERADALARLNAAVAEARERDDVAALLLGELAGAAGAGDGSIALLVGSELVRVAARGRRIGRRRWPATEPSPAAEALRRREPVLIAADEHGTGSRAMPGLPGDGTQPCAQLLTLPLLAGGQAIGAATLTFRSGRALAPEEIAHLRALADAGAQAVERARLADQERASRRMLEAVIGQLPAAVIVADAGGRIIYENDHVAAVLHGPLGTDRLDEAGVVGFLPDGRRRESTDWPLSHALTEGLTTVEEEIEIVRLDGTRATIQASAGPVVDDDGAIIGGVAIFTDVTARRQAEATREAFVGGLSHELRTPITAIYGNAALLSRRVEGMTPDVVRSLVDDIASEADRMRRLVEDLLILAKVERGMALRAEDPVLLQHRLPRVVEGVARRRPDRVFRTEIERDLPPVQGDETYIERAVENLLDNAAKYGRSTVQVEARLRADEVVVVVRDDGDGVDPEEAERLFDLFYRSAQTAGVAGGAGVGLYLVRALADAMGGRVAVAASPQGGAEFVLSLPALLVGRDVAAIDEGGAD